jgi:hypothetical protein
MNPSIYQAGANSGATGNSGFWGSIANKLGSMGATDSSGSSATGGTGGTNKKNWAGYTQDVLKDGAVPAVLGALSDTGQSGQDKLAEEKAQSEHETRRWEERNAAPTAGIGQYLARSMALQGYPVLGAINNLDFLYNKVLPYMKSYGPGKTDWRGNPKR